MPMNPFKSFGLLFSILLVVLLLLIVGVLIYSDGLLIRIGFFGLIAATTIPALIGIGTIIYKALKKK